MRLFSVSLEIHYEGQQHQFLFVSEEEALAKFWDVVSRQEPTESVYLKSVSVGQDLEDKSSVLKHSLWASGEKSPKMIDRRS